MFIKRLFAKKQVTPRTKVELNLDVSNPLNKEVLEHLSRSPKNNRPLISYPDDVQDPYNMQGSHPEVVERVWDQINSALPADCRCLIYGTPGLVHSLAGVILAFCSGTRYCIRLPANSLNEAQKVGMQTYTKWSDGGDMDTKRDLGEDWVFGSWKSKELEWCKTVYKQLDSLT